MKSLALLAAAPMLSSATPLAHGPIYAGMPPESYWMADTAALTFYVNDVAGACEITAPEGFVLMGCTRHFDGVAVIVLPNPCLFEGEVYARIACHERAHALSWPGNHPL